MSWSTYLDNFGKLSQGYIVDKEGNVWAEPTEKGPEQKATAEELKEICSHMEGTDYNYFLANGIRLGGKKFIGISHVDNLLKGKKGQESIVVYKCCKCIIIVQTGPEVQINDINCKVVGTGEYLIGTGF